MKLLAQYSMAHRGAHPTAQHGRHSTAQRTHHVDVELLDTLQGQLVALHQNADGLQAGSKGGWMVEEGAAVALRQGGKQ